MDTRWPAVGAILAVVVGGLQMLAPPAWVVVPILVWCLFFALLNVLDSTADRTRILDLLTRRDATGLYTRALGASFAFFDRMMTPKEHAVDPPEGKIARFFFYFAFNVPAGTTFHRPALAWPVADTALKLAIIYPLFALLLQWAWTGAATGIAGIPVLPAEDRLWPRLATTCPLAMFLLAKFMAATTRRRAWDLAAVWLFFAALAGASAGVVADAVATAVAIAVAVVGVVAVAFAAAFAFAGLLAGLVAGAVAGAVGFGVWRGRGLVSYACFVLAIIIAMTTVLILAPTFDISPDRRLLIFVFALLPLLNALFDYLSYGTTLTLLDRGNDGDGPTRGVVLWVLVDIVAAFVYLVALGLTLTAVVHLINTVSGVPMLDLPAVFADLRDPAARGDYTWLILACLTTLVPTLFHLALAALAATAWWGPRDMLRGWIEAEGHISTLGATAFAATGAVATLAFAFVVLAGIASLGLGLFGDMGLAPFGLDAIGLLVLDAVERLAGVFGLL